MQAGTEKNLKDAFAGESQAHMRYMVFAEFAEKENLANIARLFRAASFSEQIHAGAHLRALGGAAATLQNLAQAFQGECYEVNEMYPAFMQKAEAEGERGALRSMQRAIEAEKVHAALYEKAQQAAAAKQDVQVGTVYVCEVCGFTVEGEAPERCPLCGAVHAKFKGF